jgi:hypothetical protein
MSVSEQDIETLEAWLDSELPDEQAEAFRVRLSAEPQLAEAAARLRGDRELRSRLWQTFEPGDAEIETLVSQVRRGVRKEELVTGRLRAFSRITAVAASIAMVFMAGWISRSRLHVGGMASPLTPVAINQPNGGNPAGMQFQPSSARLVIVPRNSTNFGTPVANLATPQPIDMNRISRLAPNYEVQIIDPITHNVIFQRDLEKLQDAQQFASYIAHLGQPGSETTRQPEPAPLLNVEPVNEIQPAQP